MPRTLKWFTTLRNDQALTDGAQIEIDLLADLDVANRKGSTVTRLIIDQWIRNDTQQTFKICDTGILWLNGDAFTAGAVPDPGDESDRADWMVRFRMTNQMDATTSGSQQIEDKHLDLRAQRICRAERDQLIWVCEDSGSGTGGLFVTFAIRVLLRLP